MQRDLARAVALRYGLSKSERKIFNESWKLKRRSDAFEERHHRALDREVEQAFEVFAEVLDGGVSRKRGHRYVERRPVEGKYVVFSDHHLAHTGHRHDFFARSGNRALYTRLLLEYHAKGYTLVEAGDVEELIVFEPTLAEVRRRNAMSWSELARHRVDYRLRQLGKIVDDPLNQMLYQRLQMFAAEDRLVRIAGNHDYDLQRAPLLARLRDKVPDLRRPCDYLLLVRPRPGGHSRRYRTPYITDYAVLHGHQFDRYSNPRYAPRLGETISETLAWAYQGADRVWTWKDDVRDWAQGRRPFYNNLVVDDYQRPSLPPTRSGGRCFWEWLFKHNVAWEYFESKTATRAVLDEVLRGDEFFKYRHLDEVFIHAQLLAHFPKPKQRPRLVLGHSHEPRLSPSVPGQLFDDWKPSAHYFNSGAAGRFENLIWGLELVAGEPTLVSWSFAEGPGRSDSPVQRRVWEAIDPELGLSFLQARKRPTQLR